MREINWVALRRGAVMTNDFFRWSPRTPTTGYFLATLQVAEVSQLCDYPLMGLGN
jgi:hypothetical protein